MRDFRDPRNDHRVDVLVERIEYRCSGLADTVRELRTVLAPDIELTPRQAKRIAESLAVVGRLTAVLLMDDLERTAGREGAPLDA